MNIYGSTRKEFDAYLECQGCAKLIRALSYSEKKAMIDNPYAFVVFCRTCIKDGLHIQEGF